MKFTRKGFYSGNTMFKMLQTNFNELGLLKVVFKFNCLVQISSFNSRVWEALQKSDPSTHFQFWFFWTGDLPCTWAARGRRRRPPPSTRPCSSTFSAAAASAARESDAKARRRDHRDLWLMPKSNSCSCENNNLTVLLVLLLDGC